MEDLLLEVLKKVYQINKTTKHDLMLDFSGHVNALNIHFYKDGWSDEKHATYLETVYLNDSTAEDELKNILKSLETLEV